MGQNAFEKDVFIFKSIYDKFLDVFSMIETQVKEYLASLPKGLNSGISIRIDYEKELYLGDFEIIRHIISQGYFKSKIENNGTTSKTKFKICSVSGKNEPEINGFAAPFPISSPDKEGFISGFFNKNKNWRNYPISQKEAMCLELGSRYISNNLKGYFYGYEYIIVPNPILKTNKLALKKITNTIKTAFIEQKNISRERKRRAEEHVMKIVAKEDNYFNLDILFYKTVQASMKIQLHLEEQLPSRFNKLFIEVPEKINKNKLFENALIEDGDWKDLKFKFEIIKDFFEADFLDNVNKIFRGQRFSLSYIYEKIMHLIRNNNNKRESQKGYVEQTQITVKKAIMLIAYLQELGIINYNEKYTYMETVLLEKSESSFNIEAFNAFVKENSNFLDSDIKVGIFSVGVFIKYLFDIQAYHLKTKTPPFENKLRGYKLSPEHLMDVYLQAIQKAKQYQKDYTIYAELREIVSNYFMKNIHVLKKKTNKDCMTNNELSFYFVAGLEMGKQFKREKKENQ